MSVLNWLLTALSTVCALAIVAYAARARRTLRERVDTTVAAIRSLQSAMAGGGDELDLRYRLRAADEAAVPGPLAGAWRDYRASLVDAGDDAPAGTPVGARVPASRFFNADLPYRAGLDLRRFDALPNQLVGFGLFLTFCGLAASIVLAKQGMGAGTRATIAALDNLLSAAAFKFVTSIAAIGAALWFGGARNKLYNELDEALEALCVALDARTVPVSDVAAFAELQAELRRQTLLLEHDGEQLGAAIEAAMDRALERHLVTALKPVATAIESMGVHLGAQNVEALRQMVDRFAERLGGSARTHTDQLAAILDEAGRAMRGAPAAIVKASEAFGTLIDTEARAFGTRVNAATAGLATALAETREVLEAVTRQAGNLHAGIGRTEQLLLEHVKILDGEAARAGAALRDGAIALRAAVDTDGPLDRASARLAAAASALTDGAGAAVAFLADGEAAAATLAGHAARFGGKMTELDRAIASAVDRLAESRGDVPDFEEPPIAQDPLAPSPAREAPPQSPATMAIAKSLDRLADAPDQVIEVDRPSAPDTPSIAAAPPSSPAANATVSPRSEPTIVAPGATNS